MNMQEIYWYCSTESIENEEVYTKIIVINDRLGDNTCNFFSKCKG